VELSSSDELSEPPQRQEPKLEKQRGALLPQKRARQQ